MMKRMNGHPGLPRLWHNEATCHSLTSTPGHGPREPVAPRNKLRELALHWLRPLQPPHAKAAASPGHTHPAPTHQMALPDPSSSSVLLEASPYNSLWAIPKLPPRPSACDPLALLHAEPQDTQDSGSSIALSSYPCALSTCLVKVSVTV